MRRASRSRAKRPSFITLRRGGFRAGPPLPRWAWVICAALLLSFVAVVVWSIQRRDALVSWRTSLEEQAGGTSWPEWNPSWPSLPTPRNAKADDLRGPYAFAALNAETLRYIPCYCGCVREGHSSVLNCFVSGFSPQGTPLWTDHGFTCPLCVNILREVSLMTSRGMSLPAIRDEIDSHHRSMFATPTSTPLPR